MSQVSTVLTRVLADVLVQRGFVPQDILGDALEHAFSEPTEQRVPLTEFQALLAGAIRSTREPALGLYCGLLASESSFGVMAPLVSHAMNLRHAIALICQFHPLLFDGAKLQLTERLGVAELRCDLVLAHGSFDRNLVELLVAGLVRAIRVFGCTRSEIRSVCFEHGRPAHAHAYAAAFAGAERFSQAFTGIVFSAHALDRPHLHRHSELHAVLLAEAERTLERGWRQPTPVERLRAFLCSRPPGELPSMEAAARELGLSVRSLRRRLEAEGTSYRELTQTILYEAACSMLRNPDLTLQSVAHALGFADCTAFHRAFKRWCDVTPAEFRAGINPPAGR